MKGRTAILITGAVILVGGTGYLIYRSKRNEAEGEALLEFINSAKLLDQTNATKAADTEIKNVQAFKVDANRVRIGKLYGKMNEPAIKNLLAKTNVDAYAAMKGAGTDQKSFLTALANVKSKNTLAILDKVMKAQYGEGLFDMMKGEDKLNNKEYCSYSEKTDSVLRAMFPMFGTACWAPWLGAWMNKLPDY